MMHEKRHIATCLTLGVIMIAFGLTCWFAPKDTFSESERRALAGFPALSVDAVASGRFMSQFEDYAQDSFPFRDAFRTAKALASKDLFLKMDNNGLYTVSLETDEGPAWPSPNGPGETRTSVVSLEYPLDEASVVRATERFGLVYDRYLADAGASVFVSVIPDKGYYLAEPSGHLSMDYHRLFDLVAEGMPYATHIDITDQLGGASYYLTDSHWRQEALLGVANALLDGMGIESQTEQSEYTEAIATDRFYGVYYGQAALPVQPDTLAFLTNPVIDAASAFDHQNNRAIPVYDLSKAAYPTGSGEQPMAEVASETLEAQAEQTMQEEAASTAQAVSGAASGAASQAASGAASQAASQTASSPRKIDPYDVFLGGPLSLVTVESPLASTDRELIVFRDSFASSLAPLLLNDYAQITLVDIRYIQPALLGEYVDFAGADVLFLYSTSVLNNSETIR